MTLSEMDAGHEHVGYYRDEGTGLRCIVAVYDSRRGPAVGGTRMLAYDSEEAALSDALRLSRAMAYKTAAAGFDLGGAKGVIVGDPAGKTDDLLRAYARVVDSYSGRFVTGEDVNLDVSDLRTMREVTDHVGGADGEGTDVTAAGVVHGMRACFEHLDGDGSLSGRRVVVQGVGKVGRALVKRLVAAGSEVVVADVDTDAVREVGRALGVEAVEPGAVYDEPCDAFAPCALGGVLSDDTVARLDCRVVCGSANNQLAAREGADALAERGILYAPDYVVNAGGLVSGVTGMGGGDTADALERVAVVGERLSRLLEEADREGVTPLDAADCLAERRMAAGGERTLF
jgi:leucine dehydrogenase